MTPITLEDGSTVTLPSARSLAGSNCGTSGVWRFEGAAAGPHLAITALIHGNEVCGALALWPLLQTPPALARGRLTLAFCNLEAYGALDDATKSERRCQDEDMNRVWGRLDAPAQPDDSYEVRRARTLRPWVQDADLLLDLHSMTTPAPALGLVGTADKNVAFAHRVRMPELLLRDAGHAAGLRLIDSGAFADPAQAAVAMLVECGQHFSRSAIDTAHAAVRNTIAAGLHGQSFPANAAPASAQSLIEVTEAVTIRSDAFRWLRDWPNMGVVPQAGTLVARDGEHEVRTPHDHAYMVMPATPQFQKRGLTAVRFGRRVG